MPRLDATSHRLSGSTQTAPPRSFARAMRRAAAAGFSLIELLLVVALMAFVFAVAVPQLSQVTGVEQANKTNQVAVDVRNAFDLAVLTGKTYRFVFILASGQYRLEETSAENIYLGDQKLDRDPTAQDEKTEAAEFDQKFAEYVELAGEAVKDAKGEKEIAATSPVIKAKSLLKKPTWTKVENLEWGNRDLGSTLMFRDVQAEHHGHKQDSTELGPEGRAMIYVFPGYVEKAVLHIAERKGDNSWDDRPDRNFTITTSPFEGTADVEPTYEEVDVHQDPK